MAKFRPVFAGLCFFCLFSAGEAHSGFGRYDAAESGRDTETLRNEDGGRLQGFASAEQTLKIFVWQAPTTLNPHYARGEKDFFVCRIVYEPLASYDADGRLVPVLAENIPSLENGGVAPDGKSVVWKLKRGVQWSDGEPFGADDVVFTYRFIADPGTDAQTPYNYKEVVGVEKIDDLTVKVRFSEATAGWAAPFVGVMGMILPRHVFEKYLGTNAQKAPESYRPVGTGPYRVSSFKPREILFMGNQLMETNKIVCEANPFFREKGKPHFRRIEIEGGGTVREAARQVLVSGEADFALNLQMDEEELDEFESQSRGRGKTLFLFGSFIEFLFINQTDPDRMTEDGERSSPRFPHPFFTDKRVRKALALAIDREAIVRIYGRAGRPTSNVLVSPRALNSPNTRCEYNPAKAESLLSEAGWVDSDGDGVREKDGKKLSVLFQTSLNKARQNTQKIVKKNLESVGFEVALEIIDPGVFFEHNPENPKTCYHFYADLEMFQTGSRSPDPIVYMNSWTCGQIARKANRWAGENVQRWCDAGYDELSRFASATVDPEKRREVFIRMNDMIIEEAVVVPLVHRAFVHGVGTGLEGVELTPWDAETWKIKEWRRAEP